MLIPTDETRANKQREIIKILGHEEILSQLAEECSELAVAASKVRRVLAGTTPVTMGEAITMIVEESGDVLQMIDMVTRMGYLDLDAVKKSALGKIDRWYGRLFPSKIRPAASAAPEKKGVWREANGGFICSRCRSWNKFRKSICPYCYTEMEGR